MPVFLVARHSSLVTLPSPVRSPRGGVPRAGPLQRPHAAAHGLPYAHVAVGAEAALHRSRGSSAAGTAVEPDPLGCSRPVLSLARLHGPLAAARHPPLLGPPPVLRDTVPGQQPVRPPLPAPP